MKLTQLLLICLVSFVFFAYVQCDGEDGQDSQDVPRGKHPTLRKVFLSAPSWMHIPFSILGAIASYYYYHFYQ
ncbi:unnamed protein product [Schistosoma turkestanicum]|nr:unnamed protein product [Schistosoma turkestanicum]